MTATQAINSNDKALPRAGIKQAGPAALPSGIEPLTEFLLKAEGRGLITWLSPDNHEAYELIRREIELTPLPGDTHLVFGLEHHVVAQLALINELFSMGSDAQSVSGLSYLAMEYPRFIPEGLDAQYLLDQYLTTGDPRYRPVPCSTDQLTPAEGGVMLDLLESARSNDFGLVLTGVTAELSDHWLAELPQADWLAARESFAVKVLSQYLSGGLPEVIAWTWGSIHASAERLPYFIASVEAQARVISIVLNGGRVNCHQGFDRAVSQLGWQQQGFILELNGFREAQYVIHLPAEGTCGPESGPVWSTLQPLY
ncbi:MAG: hypothetical protein JW782_02200 [Candidatus Saganbacteria bacterium]|nr:hypothetical protein [Candidatus Saganbacteria bacterium]